MGRNKTAALLAIVGGAIGSYLLHFPLRLLEHWMMGMIEGKIAEDWQSILSFFIAWVLPFLVVFSAIYLGFWLRKTKVIQKAPQLADSSPTQNNIATQIIVVSILEEFGYEFQTTADSLRLRFSPGIHVEPAMKVEAIQLEIRGKPYDTDWPPMEEAVSGYIDKGCYIRAKLPTTFKPGNYQARILACIENKWHPSKPFTVNYQQPTVDKGTLRLD